MKYQCLVFRFNLKDNKVCSVILSKALFVPFMHDVEAHSLSFDNGSDIRDPFGYYFCRVHCGLVFKTKIIFIR